MVATVADSGDGGPPGSRAAGSNRAGAWSTAVVRVEVTDSEGDVVAAGRVTLHIDRENTFGV